MDVGIITDEISEDIEESLGVMRRCDVSIAEIRAVWGKNSIDLDPDELARLKRILSDAGASVCAISSPFFKCDISATERGERGRLHDAKELSLDDQAEVLDKACKVAEMLGTDKIRVFSFWRKSDPTPEIEARIVELFQEPLETAKARGMTLLLENEHSCFLGTGQETARVVEQLPGLKVVWDAGNAFAAGEIPFPDGYQALKPWVEHVHVKDAVRDSEGNTKFVKVGEGECRYADQIAQLKSDGYDGVLTLETHYSIAEGGKAGASEESLKLLAAMVRGV